MRFAVLADIHGNLPALEAVLEDLQRHAVDGIMVAGDLIGGAQPIETLDLLRSTANWMIRGNGENYYLDYDSGRAPESWQWSEQWASMRWLYRRLSRSTLEYLASLPEQRVLDFPEAPNLRLVHGSPQHLTTLVLPEHDPQSLAAYKEAGHLIAQHKTAGLEETMRQLEESALICGHSHIPWTYRENGQLAINAGSVGQALNSDPRAQYVILSRQKENWHVEHYAIPYDLERVRAAYHESGLLAEGGALARALLLCTETGRNVPVHFLLYADGLASEAGYGDCDIIPDRIWNRAAATFDWEQYSIVNSLS